MADSNLVDRALLKTLVPPSALNTENFNELAGKAVIEDVPQGRTIFKAGETDRKTIYLIQGEIDLVMPTGQKLPIRSGTEAARHALGNSQPRKHTAVARTACKITRIDSDLLDILLTWDQMSGIEVSEVSVTEEQGAGEDDWMTRILQSKAFMQVPAANIQAMFMRIQEHPVKTGDVIIKQGDDGDYYYIIKHGKCKVTRPSKTGQELILATLGDGDAFGEEALLSEAKRNANVVMTTDGVLMRLAKADFNQLLKEPMLNWVTRKQAEELVKKEGAVWVDVRLDSEHAANGIPGSLNVPLFMLRMKADSLPAGKKYILYCDTGRRSSAGAFLLSERGHQVVCLKGGLNAG
jgi:CRP-like cAMP-binding protein